MDTLSLALHQVSTQTYVSAGFKAGGKWAIQFHAYQGIKFNTVRLGRCFIVIEGEKKIHELKMGDCFLLTNGKPFVMCSDLNAKPMDAQSLFSKPENGVVNCNSGKDFFLIGARFNFSTDISSFLFRKLPAIIKVPSGSDQAPVMSWGLEQFAKEFRSDQQGRQLILEHLLQFLLVHSFRAYVESNPSKSGWLAALSDKNLSKAIDLIHQDLKLNWKVEDLAEAVGMSRSAFAFRFKERMGLSPITYSRNWKILVAKERLTKSKDGISEIAENLGYESESSFRLAFKRISTIPPGKYRKMNTSNF